MKVGLLANAKHWLDRICCSKRGTLTRKGRLEDWRRVLAIIRFLETVLDKNFAEVWFSLTKNSWSIFTIFMQSENRKDKEAKKKIRKQKKENKTD